MDVDIRREVLSIIDEDVEVFRAVSDAWQFSPGPQYKSILALSGDPQLAFQINFFEEFDPGLACAVINFARDNDLQRVAQSRYLTATSGFSFEGWHFEAIATAAPSVHGYEFGDNRNLTDVVVAIFPAFLCEISGRESVEQARYRFLKMIRPAVMNREPSPYLLMKYDNPKTKTGSIGADPVFARPQDLLGELKEMRNVPESFIECKNFEGKAYRIEWHGDWIILGEDFSRELAESELEGWSFSFLGLPQL